MTINNMFINAIGGAKIKTDVVYTASGEVLAEYSPAVAREVARDIKGFVVDGETGEIIVDYTTAI